MGFDILALILEAGLIVKLVLVLLAVFSATSWATILFKWRELAGAAQDSEAFLDVYHDKPLHVAYEMARELDRSPLSTIFLATCAVLKPASDGADGIGGAGFSLGEAQLQRVGNRMTWLAAAEAERLERGLPFLAMTASSAPFIGLFGTVIGIIQAFQSIAAAGSASLAVVAPGIAEALIATAVGLFAAIPASIFYNIFASRIDHVRESIDLFRAEFHEDLGRIGTPEHGSVLPD